MNKLDEILADLPKIEPICPLFDFTIFGITFILWKKWENYIDLCETFPYEPDGSVPLLFIRFTFFELIFYNKWLYKKIYKNRYGIKLEL